jgi:hypothetical protein
MSVSDVTDRGEPTPVRRGRTVRRLLIALVVSLGASAVLGIAALVKGELGVLEERVLFTTTVFAAFSLTGMAAAMRVESGRFAAVGLAGLLASGGALVTAVMGIWWVDFPEPLFKAMAILIITSVGLAYACLVLTIRPRHPVVRTAMVLALSALTVATAMLDWLPLAEWEVGDQYGRLLGVAGVLTVFGTLATPILNRILSGPR